MIGFCLGKMLEILFLALPWMTKAKDGNVKKGKRERFLLVAKVILNLCDARSWVKKVD